MEIRGGASLIPTVGGAVSGTLVFIIVLILIALLIVKHRNRRELNPSVNVTLSKFTALPCIFC